MSAGKAHGLYYEVAGDGEPLVLLPDGLVGRRVWDEQFARFPGEGYRTIRYDIRGRGASETPATGGFSHVEDLGALLDALGVDRAHLMGASNGGKIALDFALRNPGRGRSLVLVGPDLGGYPVSEEKRRRLAGILSAARGGGASRWVEAWFADPHLAPGLDRTAREGVREFLVDAYRDFFAPRPRPLAWIIPERIFCPPKRARSKGADRDAPRRGVSVSW